MADFDLALAVGEADLLDVGDAFGAEGRIVLAAVNLFAGLTSELLQVGIRPSAA